MQLVVGVALMLSVPSRAHDLYEIWSMAVLRADEFEVAVTMSQYTALRLVDPEMKARAITTENFARHRAQLEREAAALYVLTSNRKPLKPIKVEAELTEENDIIFHAAYPRPPPGRLQVHAAFLEKLGEGYGGIIDASDASGASLGWEQLSFENQNLEIVIPAAGSPKPTTEK